MTSLATLAMTTTVDHPMHHHLYQQQEEQYHCQPQQHQQYQQVHQQVHHHQQLPHPTIGNAACSAMDDGKRFQFPAHMAANMADSIHSRVRKMLQKSRLVRKADGIRLMAWDDISSVDQILGTGAFSQVSSVTTLDGNRYACKHLKQDLMTRPNQFRAAAAELAYEAHMLSSFDHPNILKIHGWAQNGIASFEDGRHNSFFLLLDMLDETLDQRIERFVTEDEQAKAQLRYAMSLGNDVEEQRQLMNMQFQTRCVDKVHTLAQIASALQYVHEQGVIFRDLKPNNIGFLGDQVKIFDFGLSRELPALDTTVPFEMSGKVGTIRYMAPEVVLHRPYNVSADVYSWSMVAYELLSLEKPYDGWTPDMHSDLVCHRGMRPDTNNCRQPIPLDLTLLLQPAWHGDPSRRPRLGHLVVQLRLFQERQRLLLEEQELQRQLSRQIQMQRRAQQQASVVAMDVNMSLFLAHQQEEYQQINDHHRHGGAAVVTGGTPARRYSRCRLNESIETIETGSLSADSLDWF